ncbi:MAG: GNAT family N-acetyltransferase [Cryomorphaceae bacterium]
MQITPLDHTSEYYAELTRGAGYFIQPFWLGLFGDAVTAYAVVKGEEALAVFHLYVYKHLHKSFVINTPMSQHVGLFLLKKGGATYAAQSDTKRIVRAIADFLKKQYPGALIDFCLPANISDVQPLLWSGLHASPRYTYRIDLTADEDTLLKAMSPERRKNIRQAEKAGYEVLKDKHPESVVGLVEQTLKRAGSPAHSEILEAITHSGDDSIFFNAVMSADKAVACAIAGADDDTAYYLAGGHDADAGDSLAGSLALWRLMLEAKERGCRYFDLMGSSVPSIERYFRGFGAVLTPYFRVYSAPGLTSMLQKLRHKMRASK